MNKHIHQHEALVKTAAISRILRSPACFGVHMTVVRTRTFKSDDGEAVLLPADVAFGDDVELVVIRSGDVMTIYPAKISFSEMIDQLRALKKPPGIEQRDDNDIPDRERL